jgi:hypothetical protein
VKSLVLGAKWEKPSDKAVEFKIHSISQRKAVQLKELLDSLKTFLKITNQGDWDQVCENPADFLRVLECTQNPDLLRSINMADRAKVQEILALIESSTKQCAERKEQIAPLVKALIPTKDTSDSA